MKKLQYRLVVIIVIFLCIFMYFHQHNWEPQKRIYPSDVNSECWPFCTGSGECSCINLDDLEDIDLTIDSTAE